jgi:hypothetical protein
VFRKFYSNLLTKRLLHKQSISVCGHDDVCKLTRMFDDVELSSQISGDFNGQSDSKVFLHFCYKSNNNIILQVTIKFFKNKLFYV